MAIYRFSAKPIKRSKGQSAVASAAYRAGDKLKDERVGKQFDYSKRSGVLHAEIIAPDNAPEWCKDRESLWNAAEAAGIRKDDQPAREIILALPHELTDEERLNLVRRYVKEHFVNLGMVADVAIHAPGKEGDERNYHAHIMLTMREIQPDGFGKKVTDWNDRKLFSSWREEWARHNNEAFERAGVDERVDHRSNAERGIEGEALPKMTRDDWRRYKDTREELGKVEAQIIDLDEVRQKRGARDRDQGDMVSSNREANKRFKRNSEKLGLDADKRAEETAGGGKRRAEGKEQGPKESAREKTAAYLERMYKQMREEGQELSEQEQRDLAANSGRTRSR